MKLGTHEQVRGYMGERSVERFFLSNNINCRTIDFDNFDLVVYYVKKHIRVQVKTSECDRWKVYKGKKRDKQYLPEEVDVIALVRLKRDSVDELVFYTPDTLPSANIRWSMIKDSDKGMLGWLNCVSKI